MIVSPGFAPVCALTPDYEWRSKPFLISGIDMALDDQQVEELMKLVAAAVVTATTLAFAFAPTPPVLAQGTDVGAASRPFPLNGEPLAGSESRGQSNGEQPEGTERSGNSDSDKSQVQVGKTGETTFRGHHVGIHKHGRRVLARHHFLIHRRGHRVVAVDEPSVA
jgi:hypothetical protein